MSTAESKMDKNLPDSTKCSPRGIKGMSIRDAITVSEILSPPLSVRKLRAAKSGRP